MPFTHKATDRTAKLVVDATTAHLTKVRPLGLTFVLCIKVISIATEYTEVLCTRKSYVLSNKA